MKKFLFAMLLLHAAGSSAQDLQGQVTDETTGEPLPGVSVFLPDMRTGTVTDTAGRFELHHLPGSRLLVQVRLIGYATQTVRLDLSTKKEHNFRLHPTAIEASEVLVTGSAFNTQPGRSSIPVLQLDQPEAAAAGSGNLVNVLAKQPGIDAISTGQAVSKPVIRGLSYNRIVTVDEGIRQEGQQWGDEHGLELDEFSAANVEVLKGPSSLLYGSDALGGVIHILEPPPPPPGTTRGSLRSRYSTNNKLAANSLLVEGNSQGAVWRLQGTYKNAAPYQTPAETVVNSAFHESHAEGMAGLNRRWGFSHLRFSTWKSRIGFTEGLRDSERFLLNDAGLRPGADELTSRTVAAPGQDVSHDKISLVNNFIIRNSQLRIHAGWQQNERSEFDNSGTGLRMHLQTTTADARYYFPRNDTLPGIELVAGASTMWQQNENKGMESLVPDYHMHDAGGFVSAQRTFDRTTLNAGFRYDQRTVHTETLLTSSGETVSAMNRQFDAMTGSAGISWQPDSSWNFRFNVGRGFRAPNIAELAAYGLHEGTFRFEVGSADLDAETSLQFDAGMEIKGHSVDFSLDLFSNSINQYIYTTHQPGDSLADEGTLYPAYRYTQGEALLVGLEASLDWHFVDRLHFENTAAWVRGENRSTGQPLPYMPPVKLSNEIRFTFPSSQESRWSGAYLYIRAVTVLEQDRIDEFETITPGATVLDAGSGISFRIGRQKMDGFFRVQNCFDKGWYNHLSRLKDVQIQEMGRNITFGLNVPFSIESK